MNISARDKKAALLFHQNWNTNDSSDGYGIPMAALKRLVKQGFVVAQGEGAYAPTSKLDQLCAESEALDDADLALSFG